MPPLAKIEDNPILAETKRICKLLPALICESAFVDSLHYFGLSLLLLYKNGFDSGKYVSFEE